MADGVIVRRFLCPTPFRPADAIHEAWETLRAGLTETPLTLTGYGRQLVDFADKQVTEISSRPRRPPAGAGHPHGD